MILKRLKIDTNVGEPTNCYIIVDEKTKEAMVIDPGADSDSIVDMLNILEAKVKYIYLTHCHSDHIGAVNDIKEICGGKVLIHRKESENLNNSDINLTYYIGIPDIDLETDSRVDDEDLIHIGEIEFKVIHTPGHTNRRNMPILRKRTNAF